MSAEAAAIGAQAAADAAVQGADAIGAFAAGFAAAEAAKPKVVGQKTVRKTGGVVDVYQTMSDGTQGSLIESYTNR